MALVVAVLFKPIVIPAIFASSLLLLPTTISTFSGNQTGPIMSTILAYFGPGQPLYLLFFAGMLIMAYNVWKTVSDKKPVPVAVLDPA